MLGEEGKLDEADALFVRVLKIQQAHFEPDDRRLAETLTNHGVLSFEQGAAQRAIEPLREALQIFELDLRHNRPAVTQALVALAEAYVALDEGEVARPLIARAQAVYDALTPAERGAIRPEFGDELEAIRAKLTEPAAPHPPGEIG